MRRCVPISRHASDGNRLLVFESRGTAIARRAIRLFPLRNYRGAHFGTAIRCYPLCLPMSSSLQTQNLHIRFGQHDALSDFTHDFAPSCWTHILGPNGAGKSTLLKALCGLVEPTSGSVMLGGVSLHSLSALHRAQNIAYVPQRLESLPALPVLDFVAHGAFAWAYSSRDRHQRAAQVLCELGLSAFAHRRLHELSGGERQLCVLASALAQNAQIILLDEPTSALDVRHAERLCQTLRMLTGRGITVISTTHALSQAARFADETILLHEGNCLWKGTGLPPVSCLQDAYGMPAEFFDSLSQNQEHSSADLVLPPSPVESVPESQETLRKYPVILGIIAILLLIACPWIGATTAYPGEPGDIFWMLRVPRVLWGALTGSVLALCGAVLQALFQNPLATPYTLGVASGASLGTMVAIQIGFAGALGLSISACAGGLCTLLCVLLIAARSGLRQPIYCLLAGVAASMFCSAVGLVVQAFASPLTAQQMMRWQLGGLEIAGYSMFILVPAIILVCAILFGLHRPLELLSVDADLAATRGIHVQKTRFWALLATGMATSLVVSVAGPIGFVGLIIPNAVRRFTGDRLRLLLPLSALTGASFLMIADTLARLLENVAWISAGVVTAILGAPIFLCVLLQQQGKGNRQ